MLRMIALLCVTLTLSSASFESQWAGFKHKHGKIYKSPNEELRRRDIYKKNVEMISKHNNRYSRGETSFYLGENRFADMTPEEIRHKMNGLRIDVPAAAGIELPETQSDLNGLPGTVDWRKKGYVTKVKDQGDCGSCWAFSAVGSVEGQHFNASGRLVSLSESNLVDCSRKWGNFGCAGGYMTKAFKYIIDNQGIDTEASYPYKPTNGTCQFKAATVGATISAYQMVARGSESDLKRAVAQVGPISVGIDAQWPSFLFYSGGVYDEPSCSSTLLDHGVLAVGYGIHSNKDYWLVKNSWGEGWGLSGYIMMSRNKNNQCGIATAASYPIV